MLVWDAIKCWATVAPKRQSIAPLSYLQLKCAITQCFESLNELQGKRVGLFIGNRPLWGIYDIALTLKGAIVVPIPTFFSKEQIQHIVSDAKINTIIIESEGFIKTKGLTGAFGALKVIEADQSLEDQSTINGNKMIESLDNPQHVSKIIYTSGTTGKPKGVLVSLNAIEAVTKSLIERSGANMSDRHLSLLPLSTLVETIGGLYVPLSAGGTIVYPKSISSPENILFDPVDLKRVLLDASPTTLNLVPSLLEAILKGTNSIFDLPRTLRFVACGGAPLLPSFQTKALEMGIPLYEGFGLSECASVVALNGIGMCRNGSVGKVLPHAEVTISEVGEIMVSGAGIMSGYTDGARGDIEALATGDLGYIDEEGYLFVTGRKDNLIITSQGRNVSPEWVESALHRSNAISQAMVFADNTGEISAFIVPNKDWLNDVGHDGDIKSATEPLIEHPATVNTMFREVEKASANLPAYAAVKRVTLLPEAFTIENGLLGADGRLNRKEVIKAYGHDSNMQSNDPAKALAVGKNREILIT